MQKQTILIVATLAIGLTACTTTQTPTNEQSSVSITATPQTSMLASPTATTNAYKNTQLFSDAKHKISFKYPNDWTVGNFNNNDCGQGCDRLELQPKTATGAETDPTLSIMVRTSQVTDKELSSTIKTTEGTDTKYGILNGKQYTSSSKGRGGHLFLRQDFIASVNSQTYWFIFTAPNETGYVDTSPLETVASTFTTTNTSVSQSTFSIGEIMLTYPNDWKKSSCHPEQDCIQSPNYKGTTTTQGEGGGSTITTQGGALVITKIQKMSQMKLADACHPGGSLVVKSCTATQLAGKAAMKRVEGNPENATSYILFTDKYSYTITAVYADAQSKTALDQIVKSITLE